MKPEDIKMGKWYKSFELYIKPTNISYEYHIPSLEYFFFSKSYPNILSSQSSVNGYLVQNLQEVDIEEVKLHHPNEENCHEIPQMFM